MAVVIKQGDSRAIFFDMKVNGATLTPDMIENLEIYIGQELRLTYQEGGVKFDSNSQRWYIWPTQEQTFKLEEGNHPVEIRRKYKNTDMDNVIGHDLDEKIKVKGSTSREVL